MTKSADPPSLGDFVFVTKNYPSALEYMDQAWSFIGLFDLTKCAAGLFAASHLRSFPLRTGHVFVGDVTVILGRIEQGDPQAAEELLPLLPGNQRTRDPVRIFVPFSTSNFALPDDDMKTTSA